MLTYLLSVLCIGLSIPFIGTNELGTTTKVALTADAETDPVKSFRDAADDPAIWVHPTNPEKSKIIGTDKKRGLEVYNLDGKKLYAYPFGKTNNVDVRYNFPLGDTTVDIVGGTNMSTGTLAFYKIAENGQLTNITGTPIKPNLFPFEWGFSFYHSHKTGKFYALVAGWGGEFEQYEIFDNGKGKVEGKLLRTIIFSSSLEGLVADDEYGYMYIAEEDKALHKYGAEPFDPEVSIVDTTKGSHLTADIEGLTIYYTSDGTGYLLVSSQGDSSFAVYRREGDNEYIGSFVINAGDIDGTWDTDGIDVMSWGLGPKYPNGLFIAQDGLNTDGFSVRNQNFKLVSWDKIAKALNLKIEKKDPRR